ncbi:MAG: hypothetical protein A4E62_02023 [Syntrophorhabdus sp. PtaU1.Bin002]|nr:MAG: hypothetical protein A4E58_00632 [Syntrophorhabdus sp. PtaB.Bin006]OPY68565.1 MAG: hypothetical protein A4E62_02023 [Syntrophorhabdus sp. PtaU1.Bin002]
MAVKKTKATTKSNKGAGKLDKNFEAGLVQLETLAKDLIDQADDPVKVGRNIVDQIHAVADRIEDEIIAEGMTLTEAYSSHDLVGVGIGVL